MKLLPLLSMIGACFFLFLSNPQAVIHIPDLATAMQVGQGISNSAAGGRTKFDYLVDTIDADHSENNHDHGDSYFRTNQKNELESIVRRILDYADGYIIENNPWDGKVSLILYKTFSQDRSYRLIGKYHIGYTAPNHEVKAP